MKKFISNYLVAKLVFATLALSAIGVFAAQNSTIKQVFNFDRPEVSVAIGGFVNRDGQTLSLAKTDSVRTGEVIDWSIDSKNDGTAAAENYKVVGQIPEGTVFVQGSIRGDQSPAVKYSIDGGKTFSAEPLIDEKQPDGSVRKVPAPISMYTQIRFEWKQSLSAKSSLGVSYRVRVK